MDSRFSKNCSYCNMSLLRIRYILIYIIWKICYKQALGINDDEGLFCFLKNRYVI